jgi:nucleotide-binding universal stress UspA family protein
MQKDFQIKKILIPYDFSETAALSLEHAIFMAKLIKAEIILLHIVETTTFPSSIAHAFSGFEKKVEEASNEKLAELANKIHLENGVQVNIITDVGKTYKRITHTAKQSHADLIIMGTHGSSGNSYSLGSNTTRVVQESSCPVISVQEHAKKMGFTKIVVPIDDTNESRQKVPFAIEISRMFSAHVFVVGIMQSSSEDYQRKFKIKVQQVEDFLVEHGVSCETKFISGEDRAKATMKVSEEVDADLVVIMTEQEGNFAGLLMGTYASKVINNSKIPVMTIRPAEIDPERLTVTF